MNLMIVTDYAAPYEGNFICSIRRLCEVMYAAGDTILFVFPYSCEQIDWVQKLGTQYPVHFGNDLKQLLYCMRSQKFDVIYTHFCLPKTQCYAKTASRIKRVPLVQHWHNHYQKAKGLKGVLINWAFEGDMNVGCSEAVMESLPYQSWKKCYVENAIDFSRLDVYDKSFRFTSDPLQTVILMFGFDYERKGVDIALDAIAPIAEEKNIKLVISLSGNHKKIREKIRQKYSKIPSWVEIVNARNDVATYYHAANIFLSAAREEGFCYALIEAAYCQCAIISSEIDGVPYKKIPQCRTFASEDVHGLRKILYERFEYNRMKAKEIVTKRFNLDTWAKDEWEILRQMKK